jgi:N-dimethylarginine dimethylaminohydrolase
MNKIIITEPPSNCWAKGYPVSKGNNDSSINKTTIYAQKNKIIPDQRRLRASFNKLKETLKVAGCGVVALPFPKALDSNDCIHHDGVFVRDVGLMFQDKWIKSNFSAVNRQTEAEVYAEIIGDMFDKKVISLPKGAFLEFGEVYYLETLNGSYYFGGLSRANRKGHDFVKMLVNPDHYYLIESKGYHLDTIFTPVLSIDNELIAIIIAKNMLMNGSFEQFENLGVEIIVIDNKDSSDEDGLGNYAVNCLVGKGFLISGSKFSTPQVEERLNQLGIKHYIVPLVDYNYSGGSVHCLTNEIYE